MSRPALVSQSTRLAPPKHTVSLDAAKARIEALEEALDALLDADTDGEIDLPDYIRSQLVELHNDGDDVPKEAADVG